MVTIIGWIFFAHNSHFDLIKTIIAVNGQKLAEKFSYFFIYPQQEDKFNQLISILFGLEKPPVKSDYKNASKILLGW